MTIDTLADFLRCNLDERAGLPALTLGDETITHGELYERGCRVSHALEATGIGPAKRMAFLDKNSFEYFETLGGCLYIGAVSVAINWRLAAPEMAYIVNDAQAEVLVAHSEFGDHIAKMAPTLEHTKLIVIIGDADEVAAIDTGDIAKISYADWVADQPTDDPGYEGGPDDVAIQLYTSGTTGNPKGAQLTNRNFAALLAAAESWGVDSDSVNLVAMPLFHIGGSGWALYGMSFGARSLIIRDLDVMTLLQDLTKEKVTHAFLVPAALQFLQIVPQDGVDLSAMKLMAYGASPITEEVLVGSMKQFNCDFIQVYGLTETCGAVTQLFPEDHDPGGPKAHLLRSAGQPLPGVTLKIVGDDGEELPDGEVGEIWIQTKTNMAGYWNLPEATEKALPGDDWFLSGDAGYLADGYLFIHDRVKDMIISGGENVYPAEIENVLMAHEGVADAAVIGVPSDKWGESAKAVIVKAEGSDVTEEELIAYCVERLAKFKCPTSVDFTDAIPRNPTGKILKRELRAPYWEDQERQV